MASASIVSRVMEAMKISGFPGAPYSTDEVVLLCRAVQTAEKEAPVDVSACRVWLCSLLLMGRKRNVAGVQSLQAAGPDTSDDDLALIVRAHQNGAVLS